MAIIIPSNHIYDINNPKIINNAIDNIEVNAKKIEPITKYRESVYADSILIDSNNLTKITGLEWADDIKWNYSRVDGTTVKSVKTIVVYADIRNVKKYETTIKIPINQNNYHIKNLILGEDNYGNHNINISYVGDIIKQPITSIWTAKIDSYSNITVTIPVGAEFENNGVAKKENDIQYSIPKTVAISATKEYGKYAPETGLVNDVLSAGATLEISDSSNLSFVQPEMETINGKDYYVLNLVLIPYCEICEVKQISGQGEDRTIGEEFNINVSGYKTTYSPKQININILGNVISLDIKDDIINIGTGREKTFSIENNELIQSDSYYINNKGKALEGQFKHTLDMYQNGKETATVLCDIGNYYDDKNIMQVSESYLMAPTIYIDATVYAPTAIFLENYFGFTINKQQNRDVIIYYTYDGSSDIQSLTIKKGYLTSPITYLKDWWEKNIKIQNIQIQTEMTFQKYDEVIPMVYGVDGKDYPMSMKQFMVLGSKVFYDGAVWQELYLQEI